MKLGFIGLGNMAGAMIGGILRQGLVKKEEILGYDKSPEACAKARESFGICVAEHNVDVTEQADVILLAVKPLFLSEVITEIREAVTMEKLVISIAAGKTIHWLEEAFGKELRLIRCMPNTPALVSEGCTAVCGNTLAGEKDEGLCLELMQSFGKAMSIPERLMDAAVAVGGSSPAFVFMFIEAMADGAVAAGMPRQQAYIFAAQSVLGSAKMVLETGMHPGELKDMVCSPGGTTIEGVRVLEEKGMRSAVAEAVFAAAEKSSRL